MIDHKIGRVWAYGVPNRGMLEGAAWLPKRIVQNLDDCGCSDVRLQLKSDQEFAIATLQTKKKKIGPNTIPINSPSS